MKQLSIPTGATGGKIALKHGGRVSLAEADRAENFKPEEQFICSEDVATIMRTFNEKPEPNQKMVAAYRKARLLFS